MHGWDDKKWLQVQNISIWWLWIIYSYHSFLISSVSTFTLQSYWLLHSNYLVAVLAERAVIIQLEKFQRLNYININKSVNWVLESKCLNLKLAPVCSMFVNYCNKGHQATHRIETSYITYCGQIKRCNSSLTTRPICQHVLKNKTLKALPLCLYKSIQSLLTNIALGFPSCYTCHVCHVTLTWTIFHAVL